jgi:hypothetical protein
MGGRGSNSSGNGGGGGSGGFGVGGGGGGGFNPAQFQMQQQPPQMAFTQQQAQQANQTTFKSVDNSPYHQLYNGQQYFQSQNLTADQMNAVIQYLRDDKEAGSLYSMSQNLNMALVTAAENGVAPKLNANQSYTYRHMMGAMHNLGFNVNLTRYDHPNIVNKLLTQCGVKNADFTRMSETQLQKALVGHTYGEEKFLSTSYNGFKNAPQSSKNVFMNRAVRIEYQAKASTQAMMPGNGPGGRLGEMVLAPSGGRKNMKVVGVKYDTNVKVRQQGTSWLSNQNQLVLVVEVD